jgi:hypothetical protein
MYEVRYENSVTVLSRALKLSRTFNTRNLNYVKNEFKIQTQKKLMSTMTDNHIQT